MSDFTDVRTRLLSDFVKLYGLTKAAVDVSGEDGEVFRVMVENYHHERLNVLLPVTPISSAFLIEMLSTFNSGEPMKEAA